MLIKLRRVAKIGTNDRGRFHKWVMRGDALRAVVERNDGRIELWHHNHVKFDPLWLHNTKTKQ